MVLNWIFGIALNTMNVLAGLSGLLLAYFGLTSSDTINIPQGMDNDGVIGLGILVLGFFGVAAAGLALMGVVVLNFGYKSHKVFLGFPYCFVTLALVFMGVAGFVLRDQAEKTMRRMYDECCVEYEDCCVKDPDSLKNMDDLHRRYNCCAFDGPSYFVDLNKVNFPKSCCPKNEGDDEGPSNKKKAKRRRLERKLRRLGGQQTEASSEVVVIDSDSDDCVVQPLFPWNAENSEERLKFGAAEAPQLASIKVRSLDELMDCPRSGEQASDVGEVIRIKDVFSLADERLKKQLEMDESGPTKSCDVQNVADRMDVDATQSCSFPQDPDGMHSQELESEKQGGNNLTTVVTVQGKPSDVRVAIRVKDISLLTQRPSETSSSYTIGCNVADADATGDTISTSVTVDNSTDIKVAIRLRDISSLTDNPPKDPVERLKSGESKILEPDGSFRSRDDFSPGIRGGATVRVKDITSLKVNPSGNKPEKVDNKKPDGKVYKMPNSQVNSTVLQGTESKKRKKPKKPKKKNKLKNAPQGNPNFQNFSQPIQLPSVPQTSELPEARPHFYSESSSTDRAELRNRFTGLNPFIRNKQLDRAVIQDMRVERRKLRKVMKRQRKQELNNWAQPRVPFHSDRGDPFRWRNDQNDFGNRESAQFGDHRWNEHPGPSGRRFDPYKNPGNPPPWQRADGRCNVWPSFGGFGVVSGAISRDNRLQRNSVPSNDSSPPGSLMNLPSTFESSRTGNIETSGNPGGVEESKSNQTPAIKDAVESSSSTFTRPTVIVSPKNCIKTQIAQKLLDLKSTMKSEVKFEIVPNLGVARSHETPAPDKSSLQQTSPSSSSVSETPSKSSASISAPSTTKSTKLPWSALSDTSWSSLFHK